LLLRALAGTLPLCFAAQPATTVCAQPSGLSAADANPWRQRWIIGIRQPIDAEGANLQLERCWLERGVSTAIAGRAASDELTGWYVYPLAGPRGGGGELHPGVELGFVVSSLDEGCAGTCRRARWAWCRRPTMAPDCPRAGHPQGSIDPAKHDTTG